MYALNKGRFERLRGADPGFKRGGGGRSAVEFLDLRFALMPLHTYPLFLLEE